MIRYTTRRDSFEIKTMDGRTAFKAEGNVLTLRDTRVGILDAAGTRISYVKSKMFSLHGTYYVMNGKDSKTLLTCKPSFRFGSGLLGKVGLLRDGNTPVAQL